MKSSPRGFGSNLFMFWKLFHLQALTFLIVHFDYVCGPFVCGLKTHTQKTLKQEPKYAKIISYNQIPSIILRLKCVARLCVGVARLCVGMPFWTTEFRDFFTVHTWWRLNNLNKFIITVDESVIKNYTF